MVSIISGLVYIDTFDNRTLADFESERVLARILGAVSVR